MQNNLGERITLTILWTRTLETVQENYYIQIYLTNTETAIEIPLSQTLYL